MVGDRYGGHFFLQCTREQTTHLSIHLPWSKVGFLLCMMTAGWYVEAGGFVLVDEGDSSRHILKVVGPIYTHEEDMSDLGKSQLASAAGL